MASVTFPKVVRIGIRVPTGTAIVHRRWSRVQSLCKRAVGETNERAFELLLPLKLVTTQSEAGTYHLSQGLPAVPVRRVSPIAIANQQSTMWPVLIESAIGLTTDRHGRQALT